MPMLLAGLLLLWLASYLLRGFVTANPAAMSRYLRKIMGYLAFGVALFMMARGEFNLAFGAGLFGLWMLGGQRNWVRGIRGASVFGGTRRPTRVNRVQTAAMEMNLDRGSGRMWGRAVAGPFAGRSLDDLSAADCVELCRWCELADPNGARLVEAYLDRRFPGRREAGHSGRDPGDGEARSGRQQPAGMSDQEARDLLGLGEGADREEIIQAHRRMMKKFHPDHGGSTAMAARVNEAKDVLMRRHP